MLGFFNLLPAFPMDGGRVLRAALALVMERARATLFAAAIGQTLAVALGAFGLMFNPMLALIAVFIWLGARSEASIVQLKTKLRGLTVEHAMITHFAVLAPDDTVQAAAQLALRGLQRHFPVVEDGRAVGILTHATLLAELARGGVSARVADVMSSEFVTASETEMLDVAFDRLQACECHALMVMRDGRLVGLLTPENIGELLTMNAPRSRVDSR